MTTIAHRVDNDVCQKSNDDERMDAIRPVGWIRRHQHRVVGHIGVGDEGR